MSKVSFCLDTRKAHEELSDGRDIREKGCNLRIVRAITITTLRDFDFRFCVNIMLGGGDGAEE